MEAPDESNEACARASAIQELMTYYHVYMCQPFHENMGYSDKLDRDIAIKTEYIKALQTVGKPSASLKRVLEIVGDFKYFGWTACYGVD